MARVFLTGGSGFIGGALLRRLLERGDTVAALARSDTSAADLAAAGADVVRGDALDEDALVRGMDGCSLVYHVAGVNTLCPEDPMELFHVNVRGAEAAVRAAGRAGIRRLVLTSSSSVIGEEKGTVGHEDSPHRGHFLSVYERSKLEGEKAALAAGPRAGVDVVLVNPCSVQGPGRAGGTGRILLAYLNGKLKLFVDAQITIVDIADAVEGHILAAERGKPGRRYLLAGAAMESREALAIVSGLTGVHEPVKLVPAPVARAAAAVAEAGFRAVGRTPPVCREMVRALLHGHAYDGSRAERELGLVYTPARDTFARTIGWALEQGLITRPLPAWDEAHSGTSA